MCRSDSPRESVGSFAPIVVKSNDDYASDPVVWDVVVVGAGVAGAALGYAQGREGRRVLLLERDITQPDRIVGELLQPGGYLALKKLGLEGAVEGIDSQIVHGYAIFKQGRVATIKYPTEGQHEDVAGRSFHHGRFVQKLREAAASLPNVTLRQGVAKGLLNAEGREWDEGANEAVSGVIYKSPDGTERVARASLTVVCDGMYSGFRKKFMSPKISHPSHFVGILMKGVELPRPNHGHVVLASPSPLLFYPISSTEVRCLIDIPGEKIPSASTGDLAAYLRDTVAPQAGPPPRCNSCNTRRDLSSCPCRPLQGLLTPSPGFCSPAAPPSISSAFKAPCSCRQRPCKLSRGCALCVAAWHPPFLKLFPAPSPPPSHLLSSGCLPFLLISGTAS